MPFVVSRNVGILSYANISQSNVVSSCEVSCIFFSFCYLLKEAWPIAVLLGLDEGLLLQ